MLKVESIKKIYSNYSNVYDILFKKFFYPRQKHVINSMNIKPNERVLDVGVGTGLALSVYPEHCDVTGIDLSSAMLRKAYKKIEKYNLSNVSLHEMDASNLEFDDDYFDHVIATFVISVVPDPVKVISEMKRVVKRNGKIIIVNHFKSSNRYIAKIEKIISPFCCKIGWRSDISLDDLIMNADLKVNTRYKMKKVDLWNVVVAINDK